MHWTVVIVVLVFAGVTTLMTPSESSCSQLPEGCHCGQPKHRDRVMCRNRSWRSYENINLTELPTNITTLILTDTSISKLSRGFSLHLPPHILKLNLSGNEINRIEDGAFLGLSRLEKLDLSHNALSTLHPAAVNGLDSLKKLDLQDNPLLCDCHLSWILEWTRRKNLKISSKSICNFPAQLRGVSLAKIHRKDMHCDWPLQLPIFEMSPSSSQLVFEGDPMMFQCNVSNIDKDTQVKWLLDSEQLPSSNMSSAIYMEVEHSGVLVSSLHIGQLTSNHSGHWLCHVSTSRGNLSRSIKMVVIAKSAPTCPEIFTWGNKGKYHWLQTLAGIVADLPCVAPPPYGLGYQPARAYHSCNAEGFWESLDVSFCPYVSEVTLVLEQFAKANLTQTIVDTARGLRNYTGNGSMLNDVMDIVFITRTLEKYLTFVPQHKELGEILLDVISVVMNVEPKLLREAQAQNEACSRLTRIVDALPEALADTAVSRYSDNLIVEEFLVKSEGFPGIRCSSFEEHLSDRSYKRNFHCLSINSTLLLRPEKAVEASVYIPASVFQSLASSQDKSSPASPWGQTHKLQFALYHSSVLFSRYTPSKPTDVTSPVISCKAAHLPLGILNHKVEVTLQVPAYTADVKPVFWNHSLYGGKGDWSSSGCHLISVSGNAVTFSCPFLGTFGILQNVESMIDELRYQQAQFRLLHPAVYGGSFLTLVCLFTSIGLYCKNWSNVRMSPNNKHSLLNTWFSLSLLVFVFTLGVPQTDFPHLCQAVGLLLHYLTLCTLIWMVITVNNLYKSLSRRDMGDGCLDDEDEEPRDPSMPPKPILRFYLVGWGVATIICGISAAVQVDSYAGPRFCFLSQSSSLAALYGPVVILLLLLLIYILLIRCLLTPESEMSGLPLVGQSGKSPSFDTHSIIDIEFSSTTLIQFHSVVLVLFLLAWVSAALAVSKPFSSQLPYGDLIFSLVYCFFSLLLGIFVFLFFCYSRSDIRKCLSGLFTKKEVETMQFDVTDVPPQPQEGACSNLEEDQPLEGTSKKVVNEIETTDKSCDVNLLANHNPPTQVVVVSNLDLFYNPRQSIVARKFFEKNRRQQQLKMLHKNNLEKEAAINGSGMPGRARAYSDTEHATSVASGERSILCTSQSYGGPSSYQQAELKALVHCSEPSKPLTPVLVPPAPPPQVYNYTAPKDSCGLPPWMVGVPCARSSCSECSNCTKPPLSLCSYSDITSVSQRMNQRRPRSRNYGKYQKAHQYSWDDKYGDSRTKMFSVPVQEGHATTGRSYRRQRRKVSSRSSVHLSPTPEKATSKNAFSRSQSASEQIGKHRVLLNESRDLRSQEHLETQM